MTLMTRYCLRLAAAAALAAPVLSANSAQAREPQGRYSSFSGFPADFYDARVSPEDLAQVADAQYLSLRKLHNGAAPYPYFSVEYEPAAYGMTMPGGFKLGDAAFPSANDGDPRWEVMGHEQGHNFFGGTSPFYIAVAAPHPFLQESLAVLSAFYVYHDLARNSREYGLSGAALASLDRDFARGRDYQRAMFERYLSQGRNFDVTDVLTSQALDYRMIELGERHGWAPFRGLARAFAADLSGRFPFLEDGASPAEQSTYVVAALSAAFELDLREDFRELAFPIDDRLFYSVIRELSALQQPRP